MSGVTSVGGEQWLAQSVKANLGWQKRLCQLMINSWHCSGALCIENWSSPSRNAKLFLQKRTQPSTKVCHVATKQFPHKQSRQRCTRTIPNTMITIFSYLVYLASAILNCSQDAKHSWGELLSNRLLLIQPVQFTQKSFRSDFVPVSRTSVEVQLVSATHQRGQATNPNASFHILGCNGKNGRARVKKHDEFRWILYVCVPGIKTIQSRQISHCHSSWQHVANARYCCLPNVWWFCRMCDQSARPNYIIDINRGPNLSECRGLPGSTSTESFTDALRHCAASCEL